MLASRDVWITLFSGRPPSQIWQNLSCTRKASPGLHCNHRSRGPKWVNASFDLASALSVCRDYGSSLQYTQRIMGWGLTPSIFLAGLAAHPWGSHACSIPRHRGAGSARAPLLGLMPWQGHRFGMRPSPLKPWGGGGPPATFTSQQRSAGRQASGGRGVVPSTCGLRR
jgi:hypothetical protein